MKFISAANAGSANNGSTMGQIKNPLGNVGKNPSGNSIKNPSGNECKRKRQYFESMELISKHLQVGDEFIWAYSNPSKPTNVTVTDLDDDWVEFLPQCGRIKIYRHHDKIPKKLDRCHIGSNGKFFQPLSHQQVWAFHSEECKDKVGERTKTDYDHGFAFVRWDDKPDDKPNQVLFISM